MEQAGHDGVGAEEDILDGIGMAARLRPFTVEAGALEGDRCSGDGCIGISDGVDVAAAEVNAFCIAEGHLWCPPPLLGLFCDRVRYV